MTSSHEETSGGDHVLLIKGKRTKRQRSASPLINVSVCSGERSSLETSGEVGENNEDEDMANCLMLLSQGHKLPNDDFLSHKKPVVSLGLGQDGVYQCKTCDKSFHSFQALGGHRASHKKPRIGAIEEKKSSSVVESMEASVVGSFLSLQVTSKKLEKTHECSICKAEFTSGQALGGHMRRHRGLTLNANANANANANVNANANATSSITSSSSHKKESIRPKNFLELDLNLPAPEDHNEPKFAFVSSKDQILHFAATSNSLIDCHH